MNNIVTAPTDEEVEYIRLWLEKEDREKGEGFYCNWYAIESSHQNKELILFHNKDKGFVGFMCFRIYGKVVHINICEVHPKYRNGGFGAMFFQLCTEYFINKGAYVAELDCSPSSSQSFWKKVGFVEFPIGFRNRYHLGVFKPLIETARYYQENNTQNDFLELQGFDRSWYWEIVEIKNKPVIFPCTLDSLIIAYNKGKEVKKDKVKYFSETPIYIEGYLIIESSNVINTLPSTT